MDVARITASELRQALELLRQARPLAGNALLELELLRARLRAEGAAEGAESLESLEWALGSLLSEIIWQHLATLRGGRGPRTPDGVTPDQERVLLAADFAADNLELEAWSGLYYRYMCRLGWHVPEIAAIAKPGHDHGRQHLQRRMARGLHALAGQLRRREQAEVRARPRETARSCLPPPLSSTPLIGRDGELARLLDALGRERLLTLIGPGGVGKSRLALAAATSLADELPDGACWVELAPLADPAWVVPTVGATLGLTEEADRTWSATVTTALADRDLLLVLDNAEHLILETARLADVVLRICPGVRLIVTSREPLHIPGERVWPVPPLAAPTAAVPADPAAVDAPAVALFVERADAAAPGLRLEPADAERVAHICRQLDGLPLAIELAAARLRTLSLRELAERLDDRFRLLVGGSRAALPHQQTLRATMDWSDDLLAPAERACFHRLSVFRAGWGLEAAEAVCPAADLGVAEVLEVVIQLVEKSLLVASSGGDATRYGMLETIRRYAAERLAVSGESVATRFRHLQWCVALAEEAEPYLTRRGQTEWLDRLDAEQDNWRTALEAGLELVHPDAVADGLRLAGALWRYWYIRGHLTEGRVWLGRLLAHPDAAMLPAARAKALHGAGVLAYQQGDLPAARAAFEESLVLKRALEDGAGTAASLNGLGLVSKEQGDVARARELFDESLALRREIEDGWGLAVTLLNLAQLAADEGADSEAEQHYAEGLRRYRELDDRWGIAACLAGMGQVAARAGDGAAAGPLLREALAVARSLGDDRGAATALAQLGSLTEEDGELDAAQAYLADSLQLRITLQDRRGVADSLERLASLAASFGEPRRAATLLGAADGVRAAIGAPLPPGERSARGDPAADCRSALGEVEYATAWQEGRQLGLDDAVRVALEADEG